MEKKIVEQRFIDAINKYRKEVEKREDWATIFQERGDVANFSIEKNKIQIVLFYEDPGENLIEDTYILNMDTNEVLSGTSENAGSTRWQIDDYPIEPGDF